jgi:anti-sigma B factor antagonist
VTDFRARASLDGDGLAIVRLEGELDLTTAAEAEATMRRVEDEDPSRTIVLDLRGLRFLDSTGLRAIISADSRARRIGRRLRVVPGPEPVHRVFRIALLDQRIEFVTPEELGGRT